MDAGIACRDKAGGRWRLKPIRGKVPVPGSLRTLIAAGIDRLDEDIKEVLRVASVIGRSFLYRLLREIIASREALDQDLNTLEEKDLIREKCRVPELEYVFKHDLIKESIYESILLERLLFNLLSSLNRVEKRGYPEGMTLCYSGPGMTMDALGRGRIARRYHNHALRSVERADNPFSESQAYYGYGMHLHFSGRRQEAVEMYDRSAAIGRDLGDVKQWAGAVMLKAILHHQVGAFHESLAQLACAGAGQQKAHAPFLDETVHLVQKIGQPLDLVDHDHPIPRGQLLGDPPGLALSRTLRRHVNCRPIARPIKERFQGKRP